jgi:hypothetical protein
MLARALTKRRDESTGFEEQPEEGHHETVCRKVSRVIGRL